MKTTTVRFNRKELWELINNYGQSYEAGGEGNELADRVMVKLNRALERLPKDH